MSELPSLMQAFGLLGVGGYIVCFACLQFGVIDGNGRFFAMASVINASLVLVSLMEHFNLPAAIIQITWIAFGLIGFTLKTIRLNARAEEERRAHWHADRLERPGYQNNHANLTKLVR